MNEQRPNIAEYTVSEVSFALRRTVEDAFGYVRVRGEISGFRGRHSSGHCYFSLKDERASIDAVVWRSAFERLGFEPAEGVEVVATGRISTFERASKYQLIVERLEPAGIGALMALLEERRRRLAAEGLFDEARKRKLPHLPRVIGVVTSPTGAVIRDILHRLADRFPVHVLVWPVRVQGEGAATETAAAIAGFDRADDPSWPRPDVLIIARGGGSIEDLWGYNEEIVVRAAAASTIPIISAVGHETDWTLIDHVADRRAPTPTGAAEIAVPVRSELIAGVADRALRLDHAIARHLEARATALRGAARGLPTPQALLATPRQRVDRAGAHLSHGLFATTAGHRHRFHRAGGRLSPSLVVQDLAHARRRLADLERRANRAPGELLARRREDVMRLARRLRPDTLVRTRDRSRTRLAELSGRLERAAGTAIGARRSRLDGCAQLLEALSHRAVLARGFVLVRDTAGHPVRRAAEVAPRQALSLEFADGAREVVARDPAEAKAHSAAGTGPAKRGRKPSANDRQGRLF